MKILHIAPVNSSGGLPTFLNHQINSLGEQSEVQILTFRGNDLNLKNPIRACKVVRTFLINVRNTNADVIHAHWGSLLGFLTVIAAPKRVPTVLTLRGSDVNKAVSENWLDNTLRRYLSRYAVSRASFCIFVSSQLYDSCSKYLKNFEVIPDGTPLEIFRPESKEVARNLLDWSHENSYIIFYCGGRPADKNLILAMESIELLRKKIKSLEFIVIENNLSQKTIATMLAAADALLFTSLSEGSPNIVREAIACGCPVVSVRVGDVEKWVDLSRAGQICQYDAECLSSALGKVIEERQIANSSIALEYSVQKTTERILDVYLNLESSNGR